MRSQTAKTDDAPVTVVISQPMYFPWVGMLEQIRLSDKFVFYNDVQFSKGSFSNRVQVKTQKKVHWMTVPLFNLHLGQLINEVTIDNRKDWKESHRGLLKQAYSTAPFVSDVLTLVDKLFSQSWDRLSELSQASMLILAEYFGLIEPQNIFDSSKMSIEGASSRRVLDIVLELHGNKYITGLGARNYLDHQLFEQNGVAVEYMDYQLKKYPQMYGEFTPFVTALDLVANCGKDGIDYICSGTINWRQMPGIAK